MTRPFVTGFLASFFLYFAIGATIPLLPRLVTQGLGGDHVDVGRLSAVFSVAAVLCRPFLSLVSRRGVRALSMVGSGFALAGFVLLWRVPNLGVLAVSRVLAAIGEALVWTAFSTLATANVPEHRQAEAVSLSSVAIFLSIGLGPLSTESFARSGHYDAAVAVVVAAAVASAIVSTQIKGEWVPSHEKTGGRLRAIEIFHPAAFLPGLTLGLMILGWSAWNNFVALRADEIGMSNAAILFTVYSVVSLGIRLIGAKLPERVGLLRCASFAAVSVACGLLILSVATTAAGLIAGAVVLSLGIAFTFPSLSALALSSLKDQTERAALIGSFGMFFEVGAGIGGFLIGPVARNAGLPAAFRVAAVGPFLALLLLLRIRGRSAPAFR